MTYKSKDDQVTLEMTLGDYATLMFFLGVALAGCGSIDADMPQRMIRFVNELNRTNPHFTPYEVSKAQ